MKKIQLCLLLAAISSISYSHEIEKAGATKIVNSNDWTEKWDEDNSFNRIKVISGLETELWGKDLFKPDSKFLEHYNKGLFNIEVQAKINEHNKVKAAVKYDVNIIPNRKGLSQNDKDFLKDWEAALVEIRRTKQPTINVTGFTNQTEADILAQIAEYKKGEKEWNKLKEPKFQVLKLGHDFLYGNFAFNTAYQYKGTKNHKIKFSTSYDLKDFFASKKLESFKLNGTYTYDYAFLDLNETINKEITTGFSNKFNLYNGIKLDLDFSKLYVATKRKFNDKEEAYKHRGNAAIKLYKNYEILKDDKHELSIEPSLQYKAAWAWDNKSKEEYEDYATASPNKSLESFAMNEETADNVRALSGTGDRAIETLDAENSRIEPEIEIPEIETSEIDEPEIEIPKIDDIGTEIEIGEGSESSTKVKLPYASKFSRDSFIADVKVKYAYKFNKNISLNTEGKLELDATKERKKENSERAFSVKATADINLKYKYDFNEYASIFAESGVEMTSKRDKKNNSLDVEPKAKLGLIFKY